MSTKWVRTDQPVLHRAYQQDRNVKKSLKLIDRDLQFRQVRNLSQAPKRRSFSRSSYDSMGRQFGQIVNSPSHAKLRGQEKIGGTTYTLQMINQGVQEQAKKRRKVNVNSSQKKVYTYRAQSARPSSIVRYEEVRFSEQEPRTTAKKVKKETMDLGLTLKSTEADMESPVKSIGNPFKREKYAEVGGTALRIKSPRREVLEFDAAEEEKEEKFEKAERKEPVNRMEMPDIDAIIAEMERIKRNKAMGVPIQGSSVDTMVDQLLLDHSDRQEKRDKPFRKNKNSSPTRRLIEMKNSSLKSKQILTNQDPYRFHPHSNQKDYQLEYNTSPGRSYRVMPGQEIDYDLAGRSPRKFMEKVYSQGIEQVEVDSPRSKVSKVNYKRIAFD